MGKTGKDFCHQIDLFDKVKIPRKNYKHIKRQSNSRLLKSEKNSRKLLTVQSGFFMGLLFRLGSPIAVSITITRLLYRYCLLNPHKLSLVLKACSYAAFNLRSGVS